MKAENKSYARTLNRRLKGWDKEDLESNLVKEVREDLELFYDKYDIETNDDYFATNLDLSPEQEAEYERIMDKFGNMAGSNVNEMKRIYEEHKDEYEVDYGVQSFEDFVNFTDSMKNYQSDALLRDVISSEQIAELYSKGTSMGFNADTMNKIILDEYNHHGLTYNDLYNKVLGIMNA